MECLERIEKVPGILNGKPIVKGTRIQEERPGTPDPDVFAWATRESPLLITFDKDFGEMSQREGRPAPFGVIPFRIADKIPTNETARLIAQNVNTPVEWPGRLWVINIRPRHAAGHSAAVS